MFKDFRTYDNIKMLPIGNFLRRFSDKLQVWLVEALTSYLDTVFIEIDTEYLVSLRGYSSAIITIAVADI